MSRTFTPTSPQAPFHNPVREWQRHSLSTDELLSQQSEEFAGTYFSGAKNRSERPSVEFWMKWHGHGISIRADQPHMASFLPRLSITHLRQSSDALSAGDDG
jgi:hypothetical protein